MSRSILCAFFTAVLVAGCAAGSSVGLLPGGMHGGNKRPHTATAIKTIAIVLGSKYLAIGQTANVALTVKDSGGNVIAGDYATPIVLGGGHLAISPSNIANSTQAAHIAITWQYGFEGPSADTLTAVSNGITATASITPTSGIAFYNVGNSLAYDNGGFEMAAGADGSIYYGSVGPATCVQGLCQSADGAIGKLTPSSGLFTQVELHAQPVGILVSSDNAIWIAGNNSHNLYRLPPGKFNQASLQVIPVPSPANPALTYFPLRGIAQDSNGKVWVDDKRGGRIMSIPVAGPYKTASIAAYPMPTVSPGSPVGLSPQGEGMVTGSDGKLYVLDTYNGVVDQFNTSTGAVTGQFPAAQTIAWSGLPDAPLLRFIAKDGSGRMYLTYAGPVFGYASPPPPPGIDEIAVAGATPSPVTIFQPQSGSQPDSIGAKGSNLYYADLYGALGYIDTSTNATRLIPTLTVAQASTKDYYQTPDGIAVMADGTAWFSCENINVLVPLCVGHTVYLNNWSAFPGPSFVLFTGKANEQGVGIMEAPSSNSGPFTAVSSKPSICTVTKVVDHNFTVVGVAAGSCTVSVTDKVNRTVKLNVTVKAAPAPAWRKARKRG